MPDLQLALDVLETGRALELAEQTAEWVNILEIGTPLLKHEGIGVVREFVRHFPDHVILVDTKTMDVGAYEAEFCFDAGADLMTVLGVADDATIAGAVEVAARYDAGVVVDLINVPDKPARAAQAAQLGARLVGIHSGIDQQARGQGPLADLRSLQRRAGVAVAGGINSANLPGVLDEHPEVVIVGGAITGAERPDVVARELREMMA